MASSGTEPSTPGARVVDHPRPLGAFAEVLADRNISVGVASDGHVLLVRPDTVLLEMPDDGRRRAELGEFLRHRKLSPNPTVTDARPSGRRSITVDIGKEDAQRINGERRLSLRRVDDFVSESRAAGFRADLNTVIIGAQTVKGNPLGTSAWWAGEMAFLGDIHRDEASGSASLLSTAEPAAPPAFWRQRLSIDGHTAPRVLVLDTGLRTVGDRSGGDEAAGVAAAGGRVARRAEHTRLRDVTPRIPWRSSEVSGDVDDEDEEFDPPPTTRATDTPSSRVLDFEAGHGTFIAGLILQQCPDAEIVSAGVLSSFGDGDVSGVLDTLEDAIVRHGAFDIVVMSFGTNLDDDEPGIFGDDLSKLLGGSLGVAAAGNQGTCRPYFPAALPGVIGVGALAADGKAWFTNFGGWVDACAPGVDVVSTFFNEFDEILDGETTRQYRGWARWSGTSFSAPKVAAAIAQEMYLYGGTAKEAWKRLSTHKHFRYPDLGVVFNV